MTTTLTPTITITVSGPTGSGKSRVLAVIADVLKLIHSDCIIDAPDVKAEKAMCGEDHTAWHRPRSGTLFKLSEINQPINTGRCIATPMTVEDLRNRTATQGAAAPTGRRLRVRDMSQEEALAWFAQYRFTDATGHALLRCEDFRELLALALNHKDTSTHDNILTGVDSLNAAQIKRQQWEAGIKSKIREQINNTQSTGAITATDLYDRPVPEHIQELMCKLGISFEEYQETDLQPVVDLVNWALMTPKLPVTSAEEAQIKQPGITEIRKYMVNELVDAMSPENHTWPLPDAVHAVIAALFVLYDQELISMELRKVIRPKAD